MPGYPHLEFDLNVLACPSCHSELGLLVENKALHCSQCQKDYPILQGIPQFIETRQLSGQNRSFAGLYDWFSWIYRLFSVAAFAYIGMPEELARREILDRLQPGGQDVLEVSIGPGVNLRFVINRLDVGKIYGLDISTGQLRRCQAYLRKKGWQAGLFLGNGECLPFKDNSFGAVFHIGGINFFNDKQKAIAEMVRVARPGSRILIADETEKGAQAYERFLPGFKSSAGGKRPPVIAPIALVPPEMLEKKVFEVWKGWMYCIEFRKP